MGATFWSKCFKCVISKKCLILCQILQKCVPVNNTEEASMQCPSHIFFPDDLVMENHDALVPYIAKSSTETCNWLWQDVFLHGPLGISSTSAMSLLLVYWIWMTSNLFMIIFFSLNTHNRQSGTSQLTHEGGYVMSFVNSKSDFSSTFTIAVRYFIISMA